MPITSRMLALPSDNGTGDGITPASYGSQIGNVFTVLAVLVLIIILIVFLIRFLGRRNRVLSKSRSIRTLGAVGLGPNKSLQVLEIGENIYVVGVGDDVTLLDKLSDPVQVENMIKSFEEAPADFAKLSSLLSTVTTRFRKESPPAEEELDGTAFHEVFEAKLRKLPNRKEQVKEILQEKETADRLRDS